MLFVHFAMGLQSNLAAKAPLQIVLSTPGLLPIRPIWLAQAALKTAGIFDYYLFPMGATPKKDSPDPANPVMRPTDDHTRTGLNFITCMDSLRYALKTYAEVAWLLKQNYFMYVADVEDAFLLLPLAPWLWFFMLFRCYLSDDDEEETATAE